MTEPIDFDLLSLATPYALHAVSDSERTEIERRLSTASATVADAFRAEVRGIRETMAVASAATAVEPPPELRRRVLAAVAVRPRPRWRTPGLVAAAVLAVAIAFGAGLTLRQPTAPPPSAEQVFTAPDVRTASTVVPAGGTATVVYSREKNTAVLVMNNVNPPAADTVYQMWLIADQQPTSAGTLAPPAVGPSTTTVIHNLGNATVLAFTVEPGNGSPQPTGEIFTSLALN